MKLVEASAVVASEWRKMECGGSRLISNRVVNRRDDNFENRKKKRSKSSQGRWNPKLASKYQQ
jgi:hypothetical protein